MPDEDSMPSQVNSELLASLMGASEMLKAVASTAEGLRQHLLEMGWDDHLAQHIAASWLVQHL